MVIDSIPGALTHPLTRCHHIYMGWAGNLIPVDKFRGVIWLKFPQTNL